MINRKKKLAALIILLSVATIGILLYIRETQLVYTDPELDKDIGFYETGSDEDPDKDGLTNAEELQYGTNINNIDTDGDGLTDDYEIKEAKTNPLRSDSDYDGLNDRAELLAGLDPNNKKTDGKTADKRRTFDVVRSDTRVKLTVSGNANVYNIYTGIFNTPGLANTPGLVSEVYEFYLETPFDHAELVFNYIDRELKKLGCDENNLLIFQFTNDGEFKAVDSVVDTENNTVTANLRHFSKYVLGDGTVLNADMGIQVMLLLDNSGSMYSKELGSTFAENDVNFQRVDMAQELIDYAGDSIQFGAAKFTATYTLLSELGTDRVTIKKQLDEIRTTKENFDGTYIANSIRDALSQFKEKDYKNKKYIVLLTDGETTEGGLWDFTGYYVANAIKDCINKYVTVIAIGLGNSVDVNYLQEIADKTGGIYLHASNSDALSDIYKAIYSQLNYAFVDIDEDGKNDAVTVADSGFDPKRHGFAFTNYCVIYDGEKTNGQCYGMASFAQCFYRNKVRVTGKSFDAKLGGILSRNNSAVSSYNLSDTDVLDLANLHDYRNKWLLANDEIYEGTPLKKRYFLDDETLKITDDFRQRIEQIGCKYLKIIVFPHSEAKWGNKTYKFCEGIVFDLDTYLDSGENDPEMDFMVALYWYYCHQAVNIPESKVEKRALYNGTDANTMLVSVSKGIPLILFDRTAWHAGNITKILRDIDNPRKYYMGVYDNNYIDSLSYYSLEIVDINLWDKTSISNWDENYLCKVYGTKGESVNASFAIFH